MVALFGNMKAHIPLLAVFVLCCGSALWPSLARAQTLAKPAEATPAEPLLPEAADPAPAPAQPAAPPPPVNAAPSTPVNTAPVAPSAPLPAPPSVARLRDAHHDRLFFAPTAETNPQGSFYATSYYVVLLQLGYSLSDTTQISLTATPPLGEAHIIPGDLSIKTVVLREPHVSIAAIGSASGVLGFEEFSGFLGRAGGVVTLCAEARECRLAFSVSSNIALAGPASLLFNGAGVSFRAGRVVSLIAELDTLIPLSERAGEASGLLGGLGVRLSGRAWGVDLGLMKAGKARAPTSSVLPFLAATYRYVP